MRLRDVKNIKRPYEAKENFLYAQGTALAKIISQEPPKDVLTAYAMRDSDDPAWRVWSEQTIADYNRIKSEAMQYRDICDDKLGKAKEYTTSFHFQILLCSVLIIIAVLSMMRG